MSLSDKVNLAKNSNEFNLTATGKPIEKIDITSFDEFISHYKNWISNYGLGYVFSPYKYDLAKSMLEWTSTVDFHNIPVKIWTKFPQYDITKYVNWTRFSDCEIDSFINSWAHPKFKEYLNVNIALNDFSKEYIKYNARWLNFQDYLKIKENWFTKEVNDTIKLEWIKMFKWSIDMLSEMSWTRIHKDKLSEEKSFVCEHEYWTSLKNKLNKIPNINTYLLPIYW